MQDAYDLDAPEELRKLREKVDKKFANPVTDALNEDVIDLWVRINQLTLELHKAAVRKTKLQEMTDRVIKLESEMLVVAEFKQDYFLFKKLLLMSPAMEKVLRDNLERFNQEDRGFSKKSLMGVGE